MASRRGRRDAYAIEESIDGEMSPAILNHDAVEIALMHTVDAGRPRAHAPGRRRARASACC